MASQFDKRLDRWIMMSITDFFGTIAKDNDIDFMSEDEVRDTSSLSTWVESRINGPEYKEWSSNTYTITLEVDLLISVRPTPSNIFHIHDLTGLFSSSCDNIPVYKYGDGGDYLFCLPLDPQMVKNIRKFYYGKVDDTNIKRASVMAFYETLVSL